MKKNSVWHSFGFAFKGLKVAWSERNFKLHLMSSFAVISLGLILGITKIEWLVVLGCIALVISLELVNTAIEHLVDMVSPEYNEMAGKVKDLSAAAVFAASIVVFVMALIIFLPYLY